MQCMVETVYRNVAIGTPTLSSSRLEAFTSTMRQVAAGP